VIRFAVLLYLETTQRTREGTAREQIKEQFSTT
jgi:hypothetical protein